MILISKKAMEKWKAVHGHEETQICFAKDANFSAVSDQTILLVDTHTLTVLSISKVFDRVLQKKVYRKDEIQQSLIKKASLVDIWSFEAENCKYRFRIQRTIMPLGTMQQDFLNFIQVHGFVTLN